jgi:hypothetical protein
MRLKTAEDICCDDFPPAQLRFAGLQGPSRRLSVNFLKLTPSNNWVTATQVAQIFTSLRPKIVRAIVRAIVTREPGATQACFMIHDVSVIKFRQLFSLKSKP